MELEPIDDNLWSRPIDLKFLGLHLGSRMTVARLPSGALWVHSPVRPTAALVAELNDLGEVRHVVAPNLYHHLFAGEFAAAFEGAKLYARPRLRKKRPDLHIDIDLDDGCASNWEDAFDAVTMQGWMLDEVVFVHRPSRSLITADLIENYVSSDHFITRQYLKVAGLHQCSGFSRFLRFTVRKKPRFEEALAQLTALDFERVVLSHHKIVERDGIDAVRDAFSWL